jgi:hypothetical protein
LWPDQFGAEDKAGQSEKILPLIEADLPEVSDLSNRLSIDIAPDLSPDGHHSLPNLGLRFAAAPIPISPDLVASATEKSLYRADYFSDRRTIYIDSSGEDLKVLHAGLELSRESNRAARTSAVDAPDGLKRAEEARIRETLLLSLL